jgi:uncharacterized protein (DUF433 family)
MIDTVDIDKVAAEFPALSREQVEGALAFIVELSRQLSPPKDSE